jgi:hypothetical protein
MNRIDWFKVIAAVFMLSGTVAARQLILYLDDRAKARREMLKMLHRINRNSKKALAHERRVRRRPRLLK